MIGILVGLNRKRCRIDAKFFALLCFFLRVPGLILYFIASISISVYAFILTSYFFVIYNNMFLNGVKQYHTT